MIDETKMVKLSKDDTFDNSSLVDSSLVDFSGVSSFNIKGICLFLQNIPFEKYLSLLCANNDITSVIKCGEKPNQLLGRKSISSS